MAEETKKAKNEKVTPATAADTFMPEGYNEDDFRTVGNFTPIYKPDNAYNASPKWKPVMGWLSHCDALAPIKDKTKPSGYRIALGARIQLVRPNLAIQGSEENEKIVELAAGDDLLVMLSGNLLWKKEFMYALFDTKRVWLVKMWVSGQQKSDHPSDMWVWETQLHPKAKLRTEAGFERFNNVEMSLSPDVIGLMDEKHVKQLPPSAFMRPENLTKTPAGILVDKDGVIQDKPLVQASA